MDTSDDFGGGIETPPPNKKKQATRTAARVTPTGKAEQDKRNKKLAGSLIVSDWGSPPLNKTGLLGL